MKTLTEILRSYGFDVETTEVVDWCSVWTEHRATGHGISDALAFERDAPLAASVAEAGVAVKTGPHSGYILYPEKATYWQPHGGMDGVFEAEAMPEPLNDSRWAGLTREQAQQAHDAKIITSGSIGTAFAGDGD